MALRRRWRWKWRRRAEVEVVADVEASASKPHSKISAAGRRLGVGHRLTASLGYSVLRLQVRQRQQGDGSGAAAADLGMEAVGPPPRRRSKAGRGWLDEMAAAPSTLSSTSAVRMAPVCAHVASSARGGMMRDCGGLTAATLIPGAFVGRLMAPCPFFSRHPLQPPSPSRGCALAFEFVFLHPAA